MKVSVLETELKSAQEEINRLKSDQSQEKSMDLSHLNLQVSTLTSRVNSLEGNLERKMDDDDGTYGLKSRIESVENKINGAFGLKNRMDDVERKMNDVEYKLRWGH